MSRAAWVGRVSVFALSCASCLAQGILTTVAGTDFVFPAGGAAVQAPIGPVHGVVVVSSGEIYLTAPTHNLVLRVRTDGRLDVAAGNGIRGFSGEGAPAPFASLNYPTGIAADIAGNIYFSDSENHRVRRIRSDGVVETFAGDPDAAELGDDGPARSARLFFPQGLAFDPAGNLYIADSAHHRIRRVTPGGTITTVAGTGEAGYSGDGGAATLARLRNPEGVFAGAGGEVWIADSQNHVVRRIGAGGTIATIAGVGRAGFGGDDGPATAALLNKPKGVTVDASGAVWIADTDNHRLRRVNAAGTIVTAAGGDRGGFAGDGRPPAGALFSQPTSIVPDSAGNLYIADFANARVRRIASGGNIATIVGNGLSRFGGDGGPAALAVFDSPQGLGVAPDGSIYISDTANHRIRAISLDSTMRTVAGTGAPEFSGDSGPAASAGLTNPQGRVAWDTAGNFYFADRGNNRVRRVRSDGTITTVAGNGQAGYSGDGRAATAAALNFPTDVFVDAEGNLTIADSFNHRVRRVNTAGVITTVAGTGEAGFSGDGGAAAEARLRNPYSVAMDAAGNLFIADMANNRIRRVSPDGVIVTVAGNGEQGFSGDGPALENSIDAPLQLIADGDGNLYFVDFYNHRIRRLRADGVMETVAGSGEQAFGGDGSPSTSAPLNQPTSIALHPSGVLYIADSGNNRIRAVLNTSATFTATPETLELSSASRGQATAERTVNLRASLPGILFFVDTATESGGGWLRASSDTFTMPGTVRVKADPSGLEPGLYRGTVTVRATNAAPAEMTIAVTFNVTAAQAPKLIAEPSSLTLALTAGDAASTRLVRIVNQGSGAASFEAQASTPDGRNWLRTQPSRGSLLAVVVDPSELAPGSYSGQVRVTPSEGAAFEIPVVLAVRSRRPSIRLTQTGLLFTAVVGGGAPPPMSFGIANPGQSSLNWTLRAVTPAGENWLVAPPVRGSSAPGAVVPTVPVRVDTAGLAAGEYYGEVEVLADGADNSPQSVSVVLNLLPAGENPGPVVQPVGMVFTGQTGAKNPASQEVLVYNLTSGALTFGAFGGSLTEPFFEFTPSAGTVEPGAPVRLVVQPKVAGLNAGVRRGVITLLFGDGSIRTVGILQVLVAPAGKSAARRAETGCQPTALFPEFTGIADQFAVPVAWPVPIEARIVNDCGESLVDGGAVVSFTNGDAPLSLVSLRDGRWAGTWTARNSRAAQTTVTLTASDALTGVEGVRSVTGGVAFSNDAPVIEVGGLLQSANLEETGAVAPGGLLSIRGRNFARDDTTTAPGGWGQTLGGIDVILGGRRLPLRYVGPNRIDAQLPWDLALNTESALVVKSGRRSSAPERVTVVSARPAILQLEEEGQTAPEIYREGPDGALIRVTAASPVGAGDTLVVRCSGLGAVEGVVGSGALGPDPPASVRDAVELTLGEQAAEVVSAALVAGRVGIYEVRAKVPAGVAAGVAALVVSTGGQFSAPVAVAIR